MHGTTLSRLSIRRILLSSLVAGLLVACGDNVVDPRQDAPAALALVTPPPTAVVAGERMSPAPVVELRTAAGERLARSGEVVVASLSNGTVGGTTSVATDAEGRATFSDLVIVSGAATAELRFTCCALAPAAHTVSLSFPHDVTVISPLALPSGSGRAGSEMIPGPSVMVVDAQAQPVEGAVVHFSIMGPGTLPVGTVLSNADGVAQLPSYRFGETPGTAIVTARLRSTGQQARFALASTVSGEVTVLDEGVAYAALVGQDFLLPPIQVTDSGVPQAGIEVRFAWTDGFGVWRTEHRATGADGRTERLALPIRSTPGYNDVDVSVVGYTPGPIRLSVLGERHQPVRIVANPPANLLDLERSDGTTFVEFRVVDGAGRAIPYVHITWSQYEVADWWGIFGPEYMGPFYTDENGNGVLGWRVPTEPGTHQLTVSSPAVAAPYTFTAVREE